MMNETEHLMTCLAEECAEVAQRVSKALRFGITEIQEGQQLTNAERVTLELVDVLAVTKMLVEAGVLPDPHAMSTSLLEPKLEKIKRFMEYSRKKGALV